MTSLFNKSNQAQVKPAEDCSFMTCILEVDTNGPWQATMKKVLNSMMVTRDFRMGGRGRVLISGEVDPTLLLKALGKAGTKAKVVWWQFGACSSNLFLPENNQFLYMSGDGNNGGYDIRHNNRYGYGNIAGYDGRHYNGYGHGYANTGGYDRGHYGHGYSYGNTGGYGGGHYGHGYGYGNTIGYGGGHYGHGYGHGNTGGYDGRYVYNGYGYGNSGDYDRGYYDVHDGNNNYPGGYGGNIFLDDYTRPVYPAECSKKKEVIIQESDDEEEPLKCCTIM